MDESGSTQKRRSSRSNVLLKATLESPGASLAVVLRNLSQDGALVQGQCLPEEGSRVLFHRQGLSVPSRIAWCDGNFAGLQFDYPLYPREILRHIPPMGSKPQPQAAAKRRPGFAPQPLTAAELRLIEQWATEAPHKLGE
jgi:hypothetical protein